MSDQTNSAESARAVSTAAETREQIVQAAVEVFLERGYDQVRVQDITRRAGYTTGALYAHFESRTSILAEAISRQGAGLVQDMIRAVGDARPGDGSLLRGLANLICAEPQPLDKLMTEAMALAARDDSTRDVLLPAFQSLADSIGSMLDVATEIGIVDPTISGDALRTFFMTMVLGGIVGRAMNTDRTNAEDLMDLIERLRPAFQGEPQKP